jgi:hemolysin activation/secretion protein
MELRWNWSNVFGLLNNLQVYAYADAARIWNEGANPGVPLDADLSSAGGGLRVTPVPGVSANVEAAKPLSRVASTQGDRDTRVFVSLSLGW